MISKRFAKFIIAGGLAAGANFGSRILFSAWMPYALAIGAAYCIGMLIAFVLNRLFVFEVGTLSIRVQAFRFILINLAAVVQTMAVSLLLAYWIFPAVGFHYHDQLVAHGVGVLVPIFTSYLGHRHFTFK